MSTDYVSNDVAGFYQSKQGGRAFMELLWGDQVKILSRHRSRSKVKARGRTGYVNNKDLGGESLLEVYFIDVGQGDGVLVKTPDKRHIMIDGGYNREKQPTGKNAADFVDWKFFRDYNKKKITLDAMIASHCDADHYGGLWDLLNTELIDELDASKIEVKEFYHAGVSWWKDRDNQRGLGPRKKGLLTKLINDRLSIKKGLRRDSNGYKLQGEWAEFLEVVYEHGCPVTRLSNETEYLDGYEPGKSDVTVRVLGPIESKYRNRPALKTLGTPSGPGQDTNGHSVLLRLDYGQSRILLTGDLNKKSQEMILSAMAGRRAELMCDVTKGCHHGSDDISYAFLQAMNPSATVISSGDNEGHAHPKPSVVAASAITGHVYIDDDELKTPLIYSTEISRSINLGVPEKIVHTEYFDKNNKPLEISNLAKTKITYKVTKSGDLRPSTKTKLLSNRLIADSIIYGLVNVRTDGKKILCAVLNEKKNKWEYETFASRF